MKVSEKEVCPICHQVEIPKENIEKYGADWRFAPFHLGCIVNEIEKLKEEK